MSLRTRAEYNMVKYRCPHCGMSIDRRDLLEASENKTEVIKIRCSPGTRAEWDRFLTGHRLKNYEDALLYAMQTRLADFGISLQT